MNKIFLPYKAESDLNFNYPINCSVKYTIFRLISYSVYSPAMPEIRLIQHPICTNKYYLVIFTPQPLRAVGVLFSPMVSGWAGGWVAGNRLSGLYLRNRKV